MTQKENQENISLAVRAGRLLDATELQLQNATNYSWTNKVHVQSVMKPLCFPGKLEVDPVKVKQWLTTATTPAKLEELSAAPATSLLEDLEMMLRYLPPQYPILHMHLQVKPLSANKMFYRNKNKTVEYREYQQEMLDEMRDEEWIFGSSPVTFIIKAGLSSKAADLDNIIKPLLDTWQTIFDEFNDNKVYKIIAEKEIVEKGKEYIHVRVEATVQDELP